MDEKNNHALVRRPSNAVQKAAPRAKRILSGMVADAHALAKNKERKKLRIVVVDDEPSCLEAYEVIIKLFCKNVEMLKFDDGEQAWQEIMRTTPDFLITDMNRAGLSGWKMLPMLAAKKVTFPILVVSASAERSEVKQFAESEINVSILSKPLDLEIFRKALEAALKIKIPRDTQPKKAVSAIK